MYNILDNKQEQKIINVVECMRKNDIPLMNYIDNDKVSYYLNLNGTDTILLDVEVTQKNGFIHRDSYIIDKDNYIDYQASTYYLK